MQQTHKQQYAEPMLVKREQLRDVTAGNGAKYKEKSRDKFSDQLS
ncbi:MAG: hypothetical protein U0172_05210 [Nitrospiraceae bacterium]